MSLVSGNIKKSIMVTGAMNYPASTIEDANEESGEISGMSQAAAFEGSQRIGNKQRKKERKRETLPQSKINV